MERDYGGVLVLVIRRTGMSLSLVLALASHLKILLV
jgi:hypothetical protein